MDYAKIYEDFYSKYYIKTELFVKLYFTKCKGDSRAFGYTINNVRVYITNTVQKKHIILNNKSLENLHHIFSTRFSHYETDEIKKIFANEIKTAFDKIKKTDLPKDYNYAKFIKDVASLEIMNEILRLLQNNSGLFERFYQLNDYQKFEIKEYGDLLNRTAIFIELDSRIYPQYYKLENEFVGNKKEVKEETIANIAPLLFISSEVSSCFLDYQKKYILDFYIDYSYLKKRMEDEKLIHYHKDNDFMKMIFKNLQLISEDNYNLYLEQGKLKSLHKSYTENRQNNFNIVFATVLASK